MTTDEFTEDPPPGRRRSTRYTVTLVVEVVAPGSLAAVSRLLDPLHNVPGGSPVDIVDVSVSESTGILR